MVMIPIIDMMSFLATFEHDDELDGCTEGITVGLIIGVGFVIEVMTVSTKIYNTE